MSEEKQPLLSGRDQWKILARLLTYASPFKKPIIFAFVLLLLMTIGDVLGPILIKIFIDDFLTPRTFPIEPLVALAAAYMII